MPNDSPRKQPGRLRQRKPLDIPPALLGVDAAAEYIGLSRGAIFKMLAGAEPELRSIMYRRRRLIPRGELDAWVRREFEAEHGVEPPKPDAA
jgi:excisionase family DNA binding protein